MKNTGTLVGATLRVNDDLDAYPVALQSEIKGGHHSVSSIALRDTIPMHLREIGMTCYVSQDKNTYELDADLITWLLKIGGGSGGGTTSPGTGGTASNITIISGNFGEWINVPSASSTIFDEQITFQYKGDLLAFPTRSIVYLKGQFGLNSAFVGTAITLGQLPVSNRPEAQIKQYAICKNIEYFLIIETNGDVKFLSKDGFNLPVATSGSETQPYSINLFFHPAVTTVTPTTYTTTRTQNFTRNNCGPGTGTVISFNKTYTSTVSQTDADNQAANDTNYSTEGQNYANANGTCSLYVLTLLLRIVPSGASNIVKAFLVDPNGNAITIPTTIFVFFQYHSDIISGGDYDMMDDFQIPPGQSEFNIFSFDPSYELISSLAITFITQNPFSGFNIITE